MFATQKAQNASRFPVTRRELQAQLADRHRRVSIATRGILRPKLRRHKCKGRLCTDLSFHATQANVRLRCGARGAHEVT